MVARDKVGHNGLGPLFSVTEAIEILPPCEIKRAYKYSVHLLLDVNTKVLGVKEDLVLKVVVHSAPAIAWERRSTKGVAVSVGPRVGVADTCSTCSQYRRV